MIGKKQISSNKTSQDIKKKIINCLEKTKDIQLMTNNVTNTQLVNNCKKLLELINKLYSETMIKLSENFEENIL